MLPTGNTNQYETTFPDNDVDLQFDFMHVFEVMNNPGNGKIYLDIAKETPCIIVKVEPQSQR